MAGAREPDIDYRKRYESLQRGIVTMIPIVMVLCAIYLMLLPRIVDMACKPAQIPIGHFDVVTDPVPFVAVHNAHALCHMNYGLLLMAQMAASAVANTPDMLRYAVKTSGGFISPLPYLRDAANKLDAAQREFIGNAKPNKNTR